MNGAAERPSAELGKRTRDSREQLSLSPTNKKQKMYSPEEGRLTGRYNDGVPRDRVVIALPGPNDRMNDEAKNSQANPVRSKPGAAFQHRAQNNIHAPQAGRAGRGPHAFKAAAAKAHVATKPTRSTPRGPAVSEGVGDAFQIQSPSKRRKTNGASLTSTRQNPVEVPDDEDEIRVLQVNGKDCSSDGKRTPIDLLSQSQSQSQSQPTNDYFGAPEQKTVNSFLNPKPHKPRRRNPSGQMSPSESSVVPSGHHAHTLPVSGTQPQYINDLATPNVSSRSKASAKVNVDKNKMQQRPDIELGKGVDDFDEEGWQRRKDDHKVVNLNNNLGHISKPPVIPTSPKDGERLMSSAVEQRTPRQSRVPALSDQDQSLRNKFIRDTGTTPQQHQQPRRPSLVKNMQVASSNGKTNPVEESPDHLHGGNTSFPRRQVKQSPARAVAQSPTRKRSPSDLLPTNFTSSAQKPARTMKPARTSQRIPKEDDNIRIALDRFISKGCVLDAGVEDKYIELVWQTENAAFVVQVNGQSYRIPGTEEYMTVGKQESTTWHSGKGSTQVVLKGSARENRSNGTILLSFVDQQGKQECWDWLTVASGDTLNTVAEIDGRIGKLFNNQAKEVELDARRHAEQTKTKKLVTVTRAQRDLNRRAKEQSMTSENIIYEQSDEGDKRQGSARSRMRDNTEPASSQLLPSPYFPEDEHRTTRKSTRQSKPVINKTPTPPPAPPRWSENHKLEPWHQPVMYPPTGARRTIVDFQDIERLDEGEFLNDNLVGYALRRIEENMAPEHKSKVHFFNSYFFTALTSKNGRKAFNYDAVKKWTKQKDLFDTPYIVVPINENLHWFVAVICNLPNLMRKSAPLDDEAADTAETPPTSQRPSTQPSPIRDPEVPESQDPDKIDEQAMRQLSLDESDKVSAKGGDAFKLDEDNILVGSAVDSRRDEEVTQKDGRQSVKKSKKRAAPPLRRYPTDKPTIITLDSFGVGHPGQVSTLKKYVEAEAMDKRGMDAAGAGIQGMTAAGIPVQSNYCDCGLYLVGYVAEFAKDPEGFVNKVLTRQLDQDSDFASFDPSDKRTEIRDDLLKLHAEQDEARLALKKAKKEEKEKSKVAATAVNAQTSATPAASTRPSPVPQPAAEHSVIASQLSEAKNAVLPTASRVSPEKLGRQPESGRNLKPHARETSVQSETNRPGDASGDDDELAEGPAKPFVTGARNPLPNRDVSLAGPGAENGEILLDGTTESKEENMSEYAQRRNWHKVTSPGLDTLGQILQGGPSMDASVSPKKKSPSAKTTL